MWPGHRAIVAAAATSRSWLLPFAGWFVSFFYFLYLFCFIRLVPFPGPRFCTVAFATPAMAEAAVATLDGAELRGSILRVAPKRPCAWAQTQMGESPFYS